jgi:hypothetical protein
LKRFTIDKYFNQANGKHIIRYVFKNKMPALLAGVKLTSRLEYEIKDDKYQTINIVELFNNQLQVNIYTNRKYLLFFYYSEDY